MEDCSACLCDARRQALLEAIEREGFLGWEEAIQEIVNQYGYRTHGLANIYANQTRAKIAPDRELIYPFPDGTVKSWQMVLSLLCGKLKALTPTITTGNG